MTSLPVMNMLQLHAISLSLACAVSPSSRSAEQPPKPVITEGGYIGYSTVADALATLESQGFMAVSGINGDVSFFGPGNETTWTFSGKGDPVYPSAVRYVYSKSGGVLHVEFTILCEASAERCEKFRSDIRNNLAQISKVMEGDPSVKCWVGSTTKCGTEPARKQTGQEIYVQLGDAGNCLVDGISSPCLDVGRKIRADHQSDDPTVFICASANAKYDAVGNLLRVVADEHLPGVFGCPPH